MRRRSLLVSKVLGSWLIPWMLLSGVIRNSAILLFERCLQPSCSDTRATEPKISEIGPAGRPLFESCSLGGAPLFTLARLRRFLARRRYMRAISAMQESGVIVSAMGQDIPQRVLSEPVSVPRVAIRKTVNATAYNHNLRLPTAPYHHSNDRGGPSMGTGGKLVLPGSRFPPHAGSLGSDPS
jgi:hypothetical protein